MFHGWSGSANCRIIAGVGSLNISIPLARCVVVAHRQLDDDAVLQGSIIILVGPGLVTLILIIIAVGGGVLIAVGFVAATAAVVLLVGVVIVVSLVLGSSRIGCSYG